MAKAFLGDFAQYLRRLFPGYDNDARTDGELLDRFVKRRDEDAFLSLVQRHGPMVLRTCQRILGERHLAEDSFQATFIVLARRAAAIRSRPSLSTWLYAVAQRVANKARAKTSLQRNRERQLGHMARAADLDEHTWQELSSVLDEEMSRLAEKYRAPLVLCYLQNKSQEKAANELGLAKGTLARRLARGRALLRQQLIKRGITLSAAAMATALCERVGGAPLSAMLTVNTAKAAASVLAGNALIGGGAAALAWQLADEALVGMAGVKSKLIVLALVVGLALGGAGWAQYSGLGEKAQQAPEAQARQPAANQRKGGSQKQKPPVAVDRYGDPLPDGALARIGTLRYRHPDTIFWLALARDAEIIVSRGGDGVRVWESKTGKELKHFPHLAGNSNTGCDLSPDGSTLAAVHINTNNLSLWNMTTGRQLRDFGNKHSCFRFAPDGKLLVADADGATVNLWNAAMDKVVQSWQPHKGGCTCAAFSRNGKTLATSGNDKTIRLWDVASGKQTRAISTESKSIDRIELSPDGTLVASHGSKIGKPVAQGGNVFSVATGEDNFIRIWDVPSGKEVRPLVPSDHKVSGFSGGLSDFLFGPDGKTIVTNRDTALRIWDLSTGDEIRRIPLDCLFSWGLSFSRDGKVLATASGGFTIRLFDYLTGKDLAPPGAPQISGTKSVFSSRGDYLAIANYKTINVWDPLTGKLQFEMNGNEGLITDIGVAGDGRTIFSVSMKKEIASWDLNTRKKVHGFELKGLSEWSTFDVSANGGTIAVAMGAAAALIDSVTGKQLKEFGGHGSISHTVFVEGGKKLAVCSADHKLHLWDVASGRKIIEFPFPKDRVRTLPPMAAGAAVGFSAYTVAISPDSRLIAYGSQDKFLALMELETGREIACFTDLPAGPCPMAFSPDGRTLAWGGWWEAPVHLMETSTGKERHVFFGHKGRVVEIGYSPDGKILVSGSQDTTSLVWDLAGRQESESSPLSTGDLSQAWEDLAGEDAGRAYQSIKKLARDPARSIPFLNHRLQMVQPVDQKRLTALIRDLGSDVFADREKAMRELVSLDRIATSACIKALKDPPSLEVRRRLEAVIEKHKQQLRNPSPDFLRNLRALETIEFAGTLDAYEVLTRMSKGASESRLTMDAKAALQRLATRKGGNGKEKGSG